MYRRLDAVVAGYKFVVIFLRSTSTVVSKSAYANSLNKTTAKREEMKALVGCVAMVGCKGVAHLPMKGMLMTTQAGYRL